MLAWFYPGLLTTFALGKNKLTSYWSKRVISNHKKKFKKIATRLRITVLSQVKFVGKKEMRTLYAIYWNKQWKRFHFKISVFFVRAA